MFICFQTLWRLRTSLADEEGSYQARVNVFGCSDVGVVESGQAVAFLRSRAVVLGEGPLVRQRNPRWHRVVTLQARSGAIGVQRSCGQRSTKSNTHRGGRYTHILYLGKSTGTCVKKILW